MRRKWRELVVDGLTATVRLEVRYVDRVPEYQVVVRRAGGDVGVRLDGWSSATVRLARADEDQTGFVSVRSRLASEAPLSAAVRLARTAP